MATHRVRKNGESKPAEKRLLAEEDISSWFASKRDAIVEQGKPAPSAKTYTALAQGAGTHLLKLITARAEISQSVLRAALPGSNETPPFQASVDVKLFAPAGILLDQLNVRGYPPRRLLDHLTTPDDLSPKVCAAFEEVFGSDALDALREALRSEARPITKLPAAEFPIVFVPHPGGGDLQITPLAPADAHANFRRVTDPFFEEAQEGRPVPRRGRWHKQTLSGKSQNIGYAIPSVRRRFRATMPNVMGREDAVLYAWLKGGPFPRWTDPEVSESVLRYADLLERTRTYSNSDIRAGLDAWADALIRGARAFRTEMLAEAALHVDDVELRKTPSEADIILRRRWKGDEESRARGALASEHFRDRVKDAR